jgi:outer membrane protein assembly factor BamB
MATPAIRDGLVFVGDTGGVFHCVDAETGRAHWTHETHGVIWASPLVADGKVYAVNQRGKVSIFEVSSLKNLVGEIQLQGPINASPAAANSILYITTMTRLFALKTMN